MKKNKISLNPDFELKVVLFGQYFSPLQQFNGHL